jgi:hypothetical protein
MYSFTNRGEKHHKAVLTDGEVALMRSMHAEHPTDHPDHLGYRKLARIFEVPRETARRLVKGWDRV